MRLALVGALAVAVIAGLVVHDAEARGRSAARSLRMKAVAAETSAAGRMKFQSRRGSTFMSANFAHLAPDALHTVHWDAIGQDGPQFMTDHRGRAKLRHMTVPAAAATDVPQVSVTDENGDPVLECDPDAMPGMHDAAGHASHHDAGAAQEMSGMMGGQAGMCSQECMDHCMNGGTCDAQCHQDHGCTADTCCCGAMTGQGAHQQCGSSTGGSGSSSGSGMMGSGSSSGGTGNSSGGMMGGMSGSSGGGMMGGSSSGGMMHR